LFGLWQYLAVGIDPEIINSLRQTKDLGNELSAGHGDDGQGGEGRGSNIKLFACEWNEKSSYICIYL